MSVSATISDESRVLDRLRRACSRREYCRSDIFGKLSRYPELKDPASLVSTLEREGFLDEERYASAYCREKMQISGWGVSKIRYNLRRKGIPDALIDRAVMEADPDAVIRKMDSVLSRKWAQIRKAHKEESVYDSSMRLFRFGLSRGYSYDDVKKSMGRCGIADA